jgi:GT2 family glycosyltransferase/glycosyltransferase involved in cell wall biosynthesis
MTTSWQTDPHEGSLNRPTVSVIIVNLNGQAVLGECLKSVAAQEYPRKKIQTILVDNGSTDDSLLFVRETFPWVQIIEAGRNLGFAAGNNMGARAATGDFLVLLNNDAWADTEWLEALVRAAKSEHDIACVASKILDQDGKTIDFVGTAMNLYGRAFQFDEGMPVDAGLYHEPREVLAPCGAAMLVRRDLYWRVGGFDADFFAYYEDVDLGWRLWLAGYKVLFSPEALVYHKKHRTGSSFPVEQRYALSEANALRMLVKNLEEEHLLRVLPFSLFMGVKRCIEQAGLDRSSYLFGSPAPGDAQTGTLEPERRMTRVATSFLVAIDQIGEEMPNLMVKRERVQKLRMRRDEEIFARFPMRLGNPIFPWRRYSVVQDQLAKSLGVPNMLQPKHGSRLLIVTHETIGSKMAGPGIRAWELACALSKHFKVLLAAPGEPRRSHDEVRLLGYDADDPLHTRLRSYLANADVVLVMGSLLTKLPLLQDMGKPTIVDLYDPFELEKLAQSTVVDEQYHAALNEESDAALSLEARVGDFYICASERQRDFWLGILLANRRINTLTYKQDPTMRTLIDVVPFGIPQHAPHHHHHVLKGIHPGIAADDRVIFWNGGLWQWFDPHTLLDALALVLNSRDDVKLYFAAGKHFDADTVPEMPVYRQVVEHSRELGLLDRHVFFGEWIPYDERGDYLLEADLGVSIHQATLESHFASRARILDCLWAGLPVISTEGDPLSGVLVRNGLGRTVPPQSPGALAETILEMLADDGLRRRAATQAQGIRDEFAWSRSVEPIAGFLRRVAFAPDALQAYRRTSSAWQERREMQQRIDELEAHLDQIREGRIMRLLRAVDIALGRD